MLSITKSDADHFSHLKGFGGWLIFFVVMTSVGVLYDLYILFNAPSASWAAGTAFEIVLMAYGIYLVVTLKPEAPAYWTVLLAMFAIVSMVLSEWRTVPRMLIWLLYWQQSKRVLVTFGKTGFGGRFGIGETVPPPIQETQTPTQAQ